MLSLIAASADSECAVPIGSAWSLRRVEAELVEFLAHGEAGDAQPAGGFGLVAVGQFDGAAEDFAFRSRQQASVGVVEFAALGGGQQLVRLFAQG